MQRRDFLKLAAAGAALPLAGKAGATKGGNGAGEFHVFSKSFQDMDYDALAEFMAKAGFDGIEWTVRAKGHVEPGRVETDLPKAVEAARKQGLKTRMMVTAITGTGKPEEETVLKTAADCGLTLYRPGYYFYEKDVPFQANLERIKRGFAALEKLGEKTGMTACYQNHSSWGPQIFGGVVWDVWEAIKDLNPRYVGSQYDVMHAFDETGFSWPHGLELLAGRVKSVCLKDFCWVASPKNPGKDRKKFMCEAGQGIVPWKEYAALNARLGIRGPYTVHFEYDLDKEHLPAQVKRELDFFKGIFK